MISFYKYKYKQRINKDTNTLIKYDKNGDS